MPTKGIPRPSGKSVRDLHSKLIRDWDDRFSLDEEIKDLVHQRNEIDILEEDEERNIQSVEFHTGRAGGIIEHANGLIMARPEFKTEPLSLSTEDARISESIEKAVASLFERELIINDFWPAVGRDVLTYGRAFIKSMLLPSVWTTEQGYPVRKDKETSKEYLETIRKWKESDGKFPFIIQHVPALSILPLLDTNDNVLASIEQKYVTAKVLAEDMNSPSVQEALSRRTLKWYDELLVIEYIDTEWVAYLLVSTEPRDRGSDDLISPIDRSIRSYQLLRAWRHGLGKHPTIMIPGLKTELPDLRSKFKSFLFDAKDALVRYDALLSRLATMVNAYYNPSYVWNLPVTSTSFTGKQRPIMKVNLGGVTTIYADEELDVLPIPQGLPDATMLLAQTDEIIQRSTIDDVLFGRVQGSAPAYQVNLRIGQARTKLFPITTHMAMGATKVIELFLRGVEQLGEAVIINGEKITVSMAKTYRDRVIASITPKSPVDRNQDIGTANLALQFGMPWDWIVENILNVPDPATLRLQKDIQELEELPQIKERLMQDALEQLEVLIEEDELEDVTEVDLSTLPPEAAEALQQLLQQPPEEGGGILPLEGGAPPTAGGLGRGPFPEGAAPQTIAPRGLGIPNEQPQPGTALAGVL